MNIFSKVFIAGALAVTSLSSYAHAQEVINVTVDSLDGEFSDNQLKAERKYKDTAFNLKGLVYSVTKDLKNKVYIELMGEEISIPVMKAYLVPESVEKAIEFDKGDEVTLHCSHANKPIMLTAYSCDVVE